MKAEAPLVDRLRHVSTRNSPAYHTVFSSRRQLENE